MGRRKGLPGLSFSLSRALGLAAAKRRASDELGIPLGRAARQRKLGAGMGCAIVLAPSVIAGGGTWVIAVQLNRTVNEAVKMINDDQHKPTEPEPPFAPALFATIHFRSDGRPKGYTPEKIAELNHIANQPRSK